MDENPYKAPAEESVDPAPEPVANRWDNLGPVGVAIALGALSLWTAAMMAIVKWEIHMGWLRERE